MQLLREIPRRRAEWVVWVDMDIIIDRMDFEIPLAAYEAKDFIIWGREDKITQGDVLNGMHAFTIFPDFPLSLTCCVRPWLP